MTCRELVYEELEDADNPDQPVRQVLQSRVLVIDSATLPPEARLAVAEVSQTANGLRVKMHDKHGPLVSIGKHLGMFVDQVQVRARYAISDQPMSEKPSTASSRRTCSTVISARSAPAARISSTRARMLRRRRGRDL